MHDYFVMTEKNIQTQNEKFLINAIYTNKKNQANVANSTWHYWETKG